jgi:hypothetical protein
MIMFGLSQKACLDETQGFELGFVHQRARIARVIQRTSRIRNIGNSLIRRRSNTATTSSPLRN